MWESILYADLTKKGKPEKIQRYILHKLEGVNIVCSGALGPFLEKAGARRVLFVKKSLAGVTLPNVMTCLFTVFFFLFKGLDHGFSHWIELMIIDGRRLQNPLQQKWDLVN